MKYYLNKLNLLLWWPEKMCFGQIGLCLRLEYNFKSRRIEYLSIKNNRIAAITFRRRLICTLLMNE